MRRAGSRSRADAGQREGNPVGPGQAIREHEETDQGVPTNKRHTGLRSAAPFHPAETRLSRELQSDESTDSNVRLPPQTHLEADRDAIADERPHTASRGKRPFA